MGIKWPFGKSPKYPPRDWTCPVCQKYHSKPHFALRGQIDHSKSPQQVGRVKTLREEKYNDCNVMGEFQKKSGRLNGLFCPHCGWVEEIINIQKVVA